MKRSIRVYLPGLPTGLSISPHADPDRHRDVGVGATADEVSLCYGLGWEWEFPLMTSLLWWASIAASVS